MFYDLNVLWTPANTQEVARTLAFLAELGYNVIALNHIISGKFPTDLTCQIPDPLPFAVPNNLTILRRCTLQLSEPVANNRLAALGANYDILALRPIDEKTLQNACSNLDSDLISLDLSQRLSYFFKFKLVSECVKRGIRFEICYSQGLLGDANARRNLISNATQLIRASRGGRGIIISSEAKRAVGCRGPWDAINLSAIWGLAQDRGYEAVSKQARSVVVSAKLKRTGYRGIIDVVYGGEKPEPVEKQAEGKAVEKAQPNRKRKSEDAGSGTGTDDTQISKREKKRRAKIAREAEGKMDGAQ
ncbi:hypothetical protein MBLNU457_1507t1 [Dothideomycetes sp. NU457]